MLEKVKIKEQKKRIEELTKQLDQAYQMTGLKN